MPPPAGLSSDSSMNILGISAYFHDSAAALIVDGEVVAAAEEERFSRIKHDASFPQQAVAYCLKEGGIRIEDVDYLVLREAAAEIRPPARNVPDPCPLGLSQLL